MVGYTSKILKLSALGIAATSIGISVTNVKGLDNLAVIRFGRAASTAMNVGYMYKTKLYSSNFDKKSEEYKQLKSKVHKMAAEKILELCCENKGIFIKVGQHIGALDYIFPKEYVETLKILHSKAPSSTLKEVKNVIREELKQDADEIFLEFEPEPLGAASLAQVHKAKLKDGTVVAVKVQHPLVKKNAKLDLKTMEVLIIIASWVFPDLKLQWIVDETKRNIPRELNFEEEANNSETVRETYQHVSWLEIPKVYKELSSKRVITMEYVSGGQVNDIEFMEKHNIDRFEVSDKLCKLYSDMIFKNGFIHSDPHPGNILINKDSNGKVKLFLLDHGLYALWLSILNKDEKGIKKYGEELGVGKLAYLLACIVTGRTWESILSGITVTKQTKTETELMQEVLPLILSEIMETLHLVNKQMLLILKTNDLIRGVEHTLQTQNRMSSFLVMSRSCIHCVFEEEMKKSSNSYKWFIYFQRQWILFQMNCYYFYLGVKTFSFYSAFKSFFI